MKRPPSATEARQIWSSSCGVAVLKRNGPDARRPSVDRRDCRKEERICETARACLVYAIRWCERAGAASGRGKRPSVNRAYRPSDLSHRSFVSTSASSAALQCARSAPQRRDTWSSVSRKPGISTNSARMRSRISRGNMATSLWWTATPILRIVFGQSS